MKTPQSINYRKNNKGSYEVCLDGVVFHVERLMSGNWVIFTLDRKIREIVETKRAATVWLYKNAFKSGG